MAKRMRVAYPEDIYKDMQIMKLTLQEEIRRRYGQRIKVTMPKLQRAFISEFKNNGADDYVQTLIRKRGRKR